MKMTIFPLGEICQLPLRGLQRSVTISFVFQVELSFELVSVSYRSGAMVQAPRAKGFG